MKALYEAILTRDAGRIEELVRRGCESAGPSEVADDILRFSVLAFVPSLHSRGTMYAALAVVDLLDRLVDPRPVIVECARYAAESRVPWGEAPVTDPPPFPKSFVAEDAAIDRAVEAEDLHEAERWLAAILVSGDAERPFFDAAYRHAGEEGYGFCTAATSWRIGERFPPFARFPTLRTALLEWLQSRSIPDPGDQRSLNEHASGAVRAYVTGGGRPDLFQPLLLADAILTAEEVTSSAGRYGGLLHRYVRPADNVGDGAELGEWTVGDLAYRYAIDYGTFLQSVTLADRLKIIVESSACEKIPCAARHFLESSEGFEEWSFA